MITLCLIREVNTRGFSHFINLFNCCMFKIPNPWNADCGAESEPQTIDDDSFTLHIIELCCPLPISSWMHFRYGSITFHERGPFALRLSHLSYLKQGSSYSLWNRFHKVKRKQAKENLKYYSNKLYTRKSNVTEQPYDCEFIRSAHAIGFNCIDIVVVASRRRQRIEITSFLHEFFCNVHSMLDLPITTIQVKLVLD